MVVVAVGARLVIPNAEDHTLVSWPGSAGFVGASLMLLIGLDDGKSSAYAASLLLLGLSIAGYLLARSAPFVLSGLLGLGILYLLAFNDLVDFNADNNDNTIMLVGAAVVVFVIVVTVAGWYLPSTRILSGVSVGVAGVVGIVGVLELALFFRTIAVAFDVTSSSDTVFEDGADPSPLSAVGHALEHNPYANDIYMVLGYAVVLAALWSICALATGHVGFRLLTVAILALSTPLAAVALATTHPARWSVVVGLIGGAVLLGVVFLARVSSRLASSASAQ